MTVYSCKVHRVRGYEFKKLPDEMKQPMPPVDMPTAQMVIEELSFEDFERSWPTVFLDALLFNEASFKDIGSFLHAVRKRYENEQQ